MPRPLPEITAENRAFWTSGGRGALEIARCVPCGHYIHPPAPICPKCLARDVRPVAVSGRGRIATFTVNHQKWLPNLDTPFVIAIVELDEQPGLRLMTNIIGCAPSHVHIDMRVRITFERCGDIWLPLFQPDDMQTNPQPAKRARA